MSNPKSPLRIPTPPVLLTVGLLRHQGIARQTVELRGAGVALQRSGNFGQVLGIEASGDVPIL